jgi:hypothetical protein
MIEDLLLTPSDVCDHREMVRVSRQAGYARLGSVNLAWDENIVCLLFKKMVRISN